MWTLNYLGTHRIVGPPAPLLTLATVGLIKGRHETAALLHAVRIG